MSETFQTQGVGVFQLNYIARSTFTASLILPTLERDVHSLPKFYSIVVDAVLLLEFWG